MSRWIDLNELARRVEDSNKSAGLHTEDYRKIKKWMRESPTIEIVRCGECKHYLPMQKNLPYAMRRCYCNKGAIKATNPDDFCSYGCRDSEKPNNCEDEPQTNADQHIQSVESVGSNLEPFRVADRKTEPTISKMEQVDKDINVRSKDEPKTERSNNADHIE